MRLLVFDEVVAALAPFVRGSARNGKYLTMVSVGEIGSDQTAALFGRFYNNGRFADSSYDAVSLQEILSVGLATTP